MDRIMDMVENEYATFNNGDPAVVTDEVFERVGLVGVTPFEKSKLFLLWRIGEGRIKWNSRSGMERTIHVETSKRVGIVGAFWIQKSSSG